MSEVYNTHGMWRVKPGKEAEFIEAWKALGAIFRALPNPPGPGQGILIQNVADPLQFYSVGPWHSSEDLAAMRANPQAQAGIKLPLARTPPRTSVRDGPAPQGILGAA